MVYYTQQEGEPVHSETVDRCAVVKYITDCIKEDKNLTENFSIGITN